MEKEKKKKKNNIVIKGKKVEEKVTKRWIEEFIKEKLDLKYNFEG